MSMVPKDWMRKGSLLEGYVRIDGDEKLIDSIKKEVRNYISTGKDLYETEVEMRDFLIHKYGEEWFLKSSEAVAYIIENEYSIQFYNTNEQ